MNKPMLVGILLFLGIFAIVIYFVKRAPVDAPAGTTSKSRATQIEKESRRINATLFFCDSNSSQLIPESRPIVYREDLHSQVKEVLEALIEGPKGKLTGTIPAGTKLLNLFINESGDAYVDFSEELSVNHPGGTDGEIQTVYSIVDTLTFNFPQIKRVQILLNDQAVDTLKGHIDLSRPLPPDLTIAKIS